RARHQRAADRAHLLLTARHRPGALAAPLVQAREELEDTVHVLADPGTVVPLERSHLEVLGHAHAREQPAAFGRLRDAALDDLVRRRRRDVAPFEPYRAGPRA